MKIKMKTNNKVTRKFTEIEKKRNNKRKVVKLRDRSLSSFEVVNLFEDVFDSDEREFISTIIKILGVHMLLETNQLFQLYERITKNKMKLKYIKKAVYFNLIGEYKYESSVDGEKNLFFYSTKLSGRMFLNNLNFSYNQLPLDSNIELRQRVLNLNEFLIQQRYFMQMRNIINHKMGLYEVQNNNKDKILCYFSNISSKKDVISYMKRYLESLRRDDGPEITGEDILSRYKLIPISSVENIYYFGNLTIATPYIFYETE